MDQHDRLWATVAEGPLAALYVDELLALAVGIVRRLEEVFAAAGEPARGGQVLRVDRGLHREIVAALGEAAKVRALLRCPAQRPSDWSRERYELHRRRANWLRGLLEGVSLRELTNPAVRNSIEHFDEYLDREIIKVVRGRLGASVHLAVDMLFSTRTLWDQFAERDKAAVSLLRVYIADERTFVNAGREVDVGRVHEEATQVRDRLLELFPRERSKDAGWSTIYIWKDPARTDAPAVSVDESGRPGS